MTHSLDENPVAAPSKTPPLPTVYEIIVNDAREHAVWPSRGPLPKGWRHIGKSGTRAELDAFLKEMFVETRPTPFVISGRRTPVS